MQALHTKELEALLIDTLVTELDAKYPFIILSHGFKFYVKTFRHAYFKPAHKANCSVMGQFGKHRMEITNPALRLVKSERFLDTPPRSRNEALASLMRRAGICEERGSGVDKVVFQTEFYQLPAPIFETPEGSTRAVLFAENAQNVRQFLFDGYLMGSWRRQVKVARFLARMIDSQRLATRKPTLAYLTAN